MALPIKPVTFPSIELPKVNPPKVPGVATPASPKVAGVGVTPAITSNQQLEGADFSAKLREALTDVNQQQVKAEKVADDYATGKQNDLHGTMITMTEADVQLRLTAQVRNKVIEAYREVMRMGS